jgi:hypothetical protein
MMRDDKLVRVAIRSKQPIERVVWVYAAILESAAEVNKDGQYDFDAAEAAYFLRASEDELLAIVCALEMAGRLVGSTVVKWGDRQFKSDRSAERQSRYRERQKSRDGDGQQTGQGEPDDGRVTSRSRHGDAPDTESETELETEKEKPVAIATVKKTIWVCPLGVDPQHWRDFLANRKTKRLTNSLTAYQGQLKAIDDITDDEWPPGRLVEYAAAKGWGSINDPRKTLNGRNHDQSDRDPTTVALEILKRHQTHRAGEDAQAGRSDFDVAGSSGGVAYRCN